LGASSRYRDDSLIDKWSALISYLFLLFAAGSLGSASSHQSSALRNAPRIRKDCGAKALKRDFTLEIVPKGLDQALAGKRPLPRYHEQTDCRQH
jgi:hypothetical protein